MHTTRCVLLTVRARAVALAVVAVAGLGAVESGSAVAATRRCGGTQLSWTPAAATLTVVQGTSTTGSVAFSSSCALTNAVITVSRSLARYVTLGTTAIASVPAQQPQTIALSVSVPAGLALGTYLGRISIHRAGDDDIVPATLPVTLSVVSQQQVSGQGATVTVPAGFQSNAAAQALGGPVSLNNFANAYVGGGLVPAGGATMTVTRLPLPPPPLGDLIYRELRGSTVTAVGTTTLSGASCTQESYTASFGPAATTSNVALYCPYGTHLYKVYLSYRSGDPLESQFLTAFGQLLATVQFAL